MKDRGSVSTGPTRAAFQSGSPRWIPGRSCCVHQPGGQYLEVREYKPQRNALGKGTALLWTDLLENQTSWDSTLSGFQQQELKFLIRDFEYCPKSLSIRDTAGQGRRIAVTTGKCCLLCLRQRALLQQQQMKAFNFSLCKRLLQEQCFTREKNKAKKCFANEDHPSQVPTGRELTFSGGDLVGSIPSSTVPWTCWEATEGHLPMSRNVQELSQQTTILFDFSRGN